ncbi:hypothetical protein [Cohnella fermenti]|nr:hypothetical protein [Cohnella fermenti]
MQPLPRYIASSDFDDLMELALADGDKEWFLDLVQRKKERRDHGFEG